MKISEKNFSQLLKEKRFDLNLSQEVMASRLGMSLRMYHSYEKGEYDQSVSTRKDKYLRKLANIENPIVQVIKDDECEKHTYEIQRLQKEVRTLEKIIELKEKLEPAEGVVERVTRLEYSMKYVLKYISNENEYRRTLKYIDVPLNDMSICISNSQGLIEYVNDEFTSQTGYTMDEVLGRKPGEVLQGKKSEKKAIHSIAESIKNKKRFEGEIINYNKMGDEIVCKLIIAPIFDRNDQLDKLISLAVFKK